MASLVLTTENYINETLYQYTSVSVLTCVTLSAVSWGSARPYHTWSQVLAALLLQTHSFTDALGIHLCFV